MVAEQMISTVSEESISSTGYAQTGWEQFKACLWKQNLSYWRNPSYNLTRIIFMSITSMLCGILFWQKASEMLVSSSSSPNSSFLSLFSCQNEYACMTRSNFVYLSSLQKQSTRSFQHIWLNVHGGSFLWYKQLLYHFTMCCDRTKCLLP